VSRRRRIWCLGCNNTNMTVVINDDDDRSGGGGGGGGGGVGENVLALLWRLF